MLPGIGSCDRSQSSTYKIAYHINSINPIAGFGIFCKNDILIGNVQALQAKINQQYAYNQTKNGMGRKLKNNPG